MGRLYAIRFSKGFAERYALADDRCVADSPKEALVAVFGKSERFEIKEIVVLRKQERSRANVAVKYSNGNDNYYRVCLGERKECMESLKMGEVYDWNTISSTYPDMYAVFTDAVEDESGMVLKCKLLEIVPYEEEEDTVCRYMESGMPFDCRRTTFNGPNVGVLC
ncbi:MAG: hypothetical protein K6G19_09870 [Lachnospiraceae bacterium]|nr:hypothetical protein [Lachnospiraceae bacterium]